jgi:hypothetical protein
MPIILRKKVQGPPPWVQLTEANLAALSDPAAITDGATGVSNGLITFQAKDTVVGQYDGYQEQCPMYSARLLDLLPDFDPATDVLDVLCKFAAFPLNTAKYGVAGFVADNTEANRATWNAGGTHIYPNTATVVNGGIIGATAQGTGASVGSNLLPPTAMLGRMFWHQEASPTIRVAGIVQRSGGDEAPITTVSATGAAFAGPLTDWRVGVMLERVSAVDATDNFIQLRAYVRRIRAGEAFA